eukprot:TRINITY_DN5511_c0_g1_i3.p4 TRINITY_DN5511_c0_g1~~TRINITY_DN5511_c0_g1_i3.p4  ORF type:complete len:183 (+),score=8.23 TRINITY_DN5511_c0_g1_i3:570-1118(+)
MLHMCVKFWYNLLGSVFQNMCVKLKMGMGRGNSIAEMVFLSTMKSKCTQIYVYLNKNFGNRIIFQFEDWNLSGGLRILEKVGTLIKRMINIFWKKNGKNDDGKKKSYQKNNLGRDIVQRMQEYKYISGFMRDLFGQRRSIQYIYYAQIVKLVINVNFNTKNCNLANCSAYVQYIYCWVGLQL